MVDSTLCIGTSMARSSSCMPCDKLCMTYLKRIERLTLTARAIDEVGILWEAGSVACVIVHLHEAISALEALVAVAAKASLARRVAPDADVIIRVREEAH